jgi:hypothetical protein
VLPGFVLLPLLLIVQSPTPPCADAAGCRQAAIEAASRQDFEAFHDLAWRAAQRGRPNDPELMYLLARAQSLSGRPGDALVMLRRLAQLGVPTDAATSDDFRRVRTLSGWADLEAFIASGAAPAAAAGTERAAASPSGAAPVQNPSAAALALPAPPAAPKSGVRERPSVGRAAKPVPLTREEASFAPAPVATSGGEDALRLTAPNIDPIGLAYDSASKRFVVGDRRDNKLMIADEVFNHVNDLIGAASAGFGGLTAVDIDARRGDLWVTSSEASGAAAVHKLQLVSGRVLARLEVPAALQPMTISDFAVAGSGALLLLDARGGRLLRVRVAAAHFEAPINLHLKSPASIAPADRVAYVAHQDGLAVIDPDTGRGTEVRPPDGGSLAGLRRIRWTRNALLAIQGTEDTAHVVRITLSRDGRRATAIEPLDGGTESAGTALTISRDAAYYIAITPAGAAIRKVKLR